MGDAQLLDVGHAEGKLSVRAGPRECLECSAVLGRDAAVRVPGEVLDVELVDHLLRLERGRYIPLKARWVGAGQVNDHAARSVAAAGRSVGVAGTADEAGGLHLIIVIYPMEVPLYGQRPNTPVPADQGVNGAGGGGIVPVEG